MARARRPPSQVSPHPASRRWPARWVERPRRARPATGARRLGPMGRIRSRPRGARRGSRARWRARRAGREGVLRAAKPSFVRTQRVEQRRSINGRESERPPCPWPSLDVGGMWARGARAWDFDLRAGWCDLRGLLRLYLSACGDATAQQCEMGGSQRGGAESRVAQRGAVTSAVCRERQSAATADARVRH